MPANLENSAVATGLEKVCFIPIPISKMVRMKEGMEQQLSGAVYLPGKAQVQTDTGQKVWTNGQSWVLRESRRGLTFVGNHGWGWQGEAGAAVRAACPDSSASLNAVSLRR